jgi:hypothetical protein
MAVRKTNVFKTHDYTWTYRATQGEDKAKSQLRYKDDFSGWASRCPLFGSEHPDLPGFALIDIAADREAGDQISVGLTYEATASTTDIPGRPGSDEATARYSVQVSGREEHILTNSFAADLDATELKALLAISNGNETDDAGAQWEALVKSDTGQTLLAKIRKGNVAVKSGGIVYIERKIITALSQLDYANFYKIDTPPGPASGEANSWLYLGGNAEPNADGLTWNAEKQWEFSPDGWDTDLYS